MWINNSFPGSSIITLQVSSLLKRAEDKVILGADFLDCFVGKFP
jgi:hypothetical protein